MFGALLAGSGVAVVALTAVSAPATPSAGATTFTPVGTFFVADPGANQLATVTPTAARGSSPVTLASGSGPVAVALSADGSTAWVVDTTAGKLSRVDTATGTVTTLTLGSGTEPVAVAVDPFTMDLGPSTAPVRTEVVVAEKGVTKVVAIDPATTSTTHSVTLAHPDALAVAADGEAVDVALDPTSGDGTVEVLTGEFFNPTRSATVGVHPSAIVNMPGVTGDFYVANAGSHDLTYIFHDSTVGTGITLGSTADPVAIGRSPGGTRLVVAEKSEGKATVVDLTATHTKHATTLSVATADGVAVSADGVAAVTDAAGKVDLLAITSPTAPSVTHTVTGFTSPAGVAAAPEVAPTASFSVTLADPGSPMTFNASGSTPGTSPIASYTWTFGDTSAAVTTTTPTVTHTYATPLRPSYPVTLTVKGEDGASTTLVTPGQSTVVDGGPQATETKEVSGFLDPTRAVLAYVTQSATGQVSVIDTQPLTSPKLLGQIALKPNPARCLTQRDGTCKESTYPQGITESPTLTRVYVDAYADGFTADGAVDVIDVTTNQVIQVIATTSAPLSSAISPDATTLYVAAGGEGTPALDVIALDATPPTVTAITLPQGQFYPGTGYPGLVAVGDGGKKVVVAAEVGAGSGQFDVFTVKTTGAVTPAPVVVGMTPTAFGVTVNPLHTTVAYGVQGSTGSTHAVTVLTLLHPGTTPTDVGLRAGDAQGIAADANGVTVAVLVTSGPGTYVAPLTAATGKPSTLTAGTPVALPTGTSPSGLAFLPSGTGLVAVGYGTTRLVVLDTVTKVVGTVALSPTEAVDPVGVALGQSAPPHTTPPPTTTTTTTTSTTTTTTTSPTTTTTTAPRATTTTTEHGEQAVHTIGAGHGPWPPAGSGGAPWGFAGGALLLVGGIALLALRPRARSAG